MILEMGCIYLFVDSYTLMMHKFHKNKPPVKGITVGPSYIITKCVHMSTVGLVYMFFPSGPSYCLKINQLNT